MVKLRSQRLKERDSGHGDDPYQYDNIPKGFRVQVTHIWGDAFGEYGHDYYPSANYGNRFWDYIFDNMTREMGVHKLVNKQVRPNSQTQCWEFIQKCSDSECLDIIELSFSIITVDHFKGTKISAGLVRSFHKELNRRFEQHNLGYEFIEGEIIRKDNKVTHEIIVKEAIKLLNDKNFAGPSDEFMNGLAHYRDGKYKEAINDAHKSFESTMKTICDLKGIPYQPKDNAKTLLKHLYDNNVVPSQLQSHFTGLRSTLEAGLPTIRNKNSSHGQGADVVQVSKELAQYALNLSATNIVFLVSLI